MKMRTKIVILALVCFSAVSFSNPARVKTMGRTDNFFMDDISVFYNPANVSIYPNMLMGDLGIYDLDTALDSTGNTAGVSRYNRDPVRPFFGGILSYSLNQSTEAGDQYPMISIGAVINRYDDVLEYIDPNNPKYFGDPSYTNNSSVVFKDPIGKIDVMAGYALKNGVMLGIGGYFAFQDMDSSVLDDKDAFETKVINANAGVNIPVTKTIDMEISAGFSNLNVIGAEFDTSYSNGYKAKKIADGDYSARGDIRLFSALTRLNGDFVPHLGVDVYNIGQNRLVSGELGVGINIYVDRGFMWTGVEGLIKDYSLAVADQDSKTVAGGRISFGLERNIGWDWLVWRICGTKSILVQKAGSDTKYIENPEADGTEDDMIGFGMGINIENRIRIDAVMAEDLFYTFTNLFAGSHHHLFTQFSATFSF